MSNTMTFRLDPDAARILRELVRRQKSTKSQVIKDALRAHWKAAGEGSAASSWEVYAALKVPAAPPRRDRARHVSKLLKEKLLARRRNRTL